MAVEIRVLGRVDVLVNGRPLPLGGSKQRGVLAMLALRANQTVGADELIDGLWGERPPASAAKNVQLYISRLRKALGTEASIITHGRGYELQLPDDAVDAVRFERLVDRAWREGGLGINGGAARDALELWHGAPLADVAEEPFAAPEIRRLDELHLHAIEVTIAAELAAGRHREVIGDLEALTSAHPLRERFHAQRMLALYRAGRQSEALEAYRGAHQTLCEEIGVEPGPELRRLHQEILAQDAALAAPAPVEEVPRELERASALLAGRERELSWLRGRWEEGDRGRARVVLVSGPAGIGKTRLVAELADELQRSGAAVVYASGRWAGDAAVEAIRPATKSTRPTLLVLDDADYASPAVLEATSAAAMQPRAPPLLAAVLQQDERGSFLSAVSEHSGTPQHLSLGPLPPEASAEIAELYVPADGAGIPLETLMKESDGVPLRVHRVASGWAQRQVAERLKFIADRTADERGDLQAAEAELAGSVAAVQTARERSDRHLGLASADPSVPEVCPFRGLAPFDSAHSDYFFGRERLVAGLVARLVGASMLVLVGPSGSGKSSALRAGLLPALANGVLPGSEWWRQALMRPGAHPLKELERSLARLEPDGGEERLVLAVDQLEEVFTACRDAGERTAFVEALMVTLDAPDRRLVAVLAIRADFFGRLAEHQTLSARVSANNVLVGPMSREELRRAIELPARRAGLRVESPLVSALIDDVAVEPGGLPLLSSALLELWQERSGRTLREASYAASGGVTGAVARLAERAYQQLRGPQRERAQAIMLRLADADEVAPVRRRVPLSELDVESDADAAEALAVLTESRLVTLDEGTVEVAHEALLREWPRLREWLEEDAEGRRLHQHLIKAATDWADSQRDPAELYRGARLAAAIDWAESHDPELNELEREFLERSRAASEWETKRQRRTNRRLTMLLGGVGVLLAAAVVAGAIALSERQGARDAATAEAAQRLGAQALTEDQLDRATLLANTGVALNDSVATRSNLLSTLLRSPAALGALKGDNELFSVALSPDGDTLATGDFDGNVVLFDTETRERLGDHQSSGLVTWLGFHPRNGSLAIVARDVTGNAGSLEVIDASTQRLRSSVSLGGHPADAQSAYIPFGTYALDGRSVVVVYTGDFDATVPAFLRRFDARTGSPIGPAVRLAARSSLSELSSTPNGRRLIYAGEVETYVIDAETLRVVRRYPFGAFTTEISADGTTLAIGGNDGRVRLLELASGRVRSLTERHDGRVLSAAFSPDGRRLATAGGDGTVIVWDVREGKPIETLMSHRNGVWDQLFSADGRTLYTVGQDSNAFVWDVDGDRRLGSPFRTNLHLVGVEPFPPGFDVSPDGSKVAVGTLDGTVDEIDAETLRRTGGFEAIPGRSAMAVEYSPDGSLVAVAGEGGGIGVWDATSGERIGPLLRKPRGGPLDNPLNVQTLAFRGGELLAAALTGGPKTPQGTTKPGTVSTWDLDKRQLIGRPLRLPPFVLGLDFSPDGTKLAIASGGRLEGPNGVEIWDVRADEKLARLPSDQVRSVAFSPDGRLLAGGQLDGSVLLWATDGWGRVGAPLVSRGGQTLSVAFSPDGRTLATSHNDGTVVLWDVESQQPIGSPLPGPTDAWVTARFAPAESRLFVVYDNGDAVRWQVDPDVWVQHACTVSGGDLTPEQWAEVVPEQEYQSVCPSG